MKIDRLDKALRIFITGLIYGLYIGLVFFSINGNYLFLLTFEYWITVSSTTALSLFLRWLYSDTGLEKELSNNEKISAKEQTKSELIKEVHDKNLVDLLDYEIKKRNKENKIEEYKKQCDKKIMFWKEPSILRPKFIRNIYIEKWRNRRDLLKEEEFNIDVVRLSYYRYDKDEMLSSFYKDHNSEENKRRTKNQKVLNSTKANLITFLSMAVLKGLEVFFTDFSKEDIIVLIGQLIAFTLNIYNGYNLGKTFIREDYSRNLSDDYVFLKTFLKKYNNVQET